MRKHLLGLGLCAAVLAAWGDSPIFKGGRWKEFVYDKPSKTPVFFSGMSRSENAWGLFGAAFGPVVILSLFWRRFNYAGALAGIIGGAVVDIVCLYNLKGWLGGTYLYEIVPGFIAGFAIAVIATLATKKPGAEVDAIFDKATA